MEEEKNDVMLVVIHYAVILAGIYFGVVQPLLLDGYWTWWSGFCQVVLGLYLACGLLFLLRKKHGKGQ